MQVIATGKVAMSNSATQVVGARAGRKALYLTAVGSSLPVYYGPDAGVTSSNGYPLTGLSTAVNEKVLEELEGAVYGITGAGSSASVFFMEIYDDGV